MYSPILPSPASTRSSPMGGGTTIFHSVTEASIYKSAAPPNYTGSPMNSVFRVLRPMNQIIKLGQTGPLTRRTSQRSWCYPPPIPTYSRTVVVSSVLFVVYLQCRNSHRRQSIESVQGIWRYPPSRGSVHVPIAPSMRLSVQHWRLYGVDFSPSLSCTF